MNDKQNMAEALHWIIVNEDRQYVAWQSVRPLPLLVTPPIDMVW